MNYKIIKSSVIVSLIVLGTLLINISISELGTDRFIDKGFNYIYLLVINIISLASFVYFELKKSKARLVSYIVTFVLFLLCLIGLKEYKDVLYSIRYVYILTLIIMYGYSIYNLIDLGKTIYPNFNE